MKELFLMVKQAILSHFDTNHEYTIENVLINNGQLERMEEMNQFNFPTIFFDYEVTDWFNLGRNIRHSAPEFTLNVVIENYQSMEEAIFIEDIATELKNLIIKQSVSRNGFFISEPWVIGEMKGSNETNLMSLEVRFQCNVTDSTAYPTTTATLTETDVTANITDLQSNWILSGGIWNDDKVWIDNEVWID